MNSYKDGFGRVTTPVTDTSETQMEMVQDFARITCAESGCSGCNFIHRRVLGEPRYFIDGERASQAAYEEAINRATEAVTP